jgi:hypothetical protein
MAASDIHLSPSQQYSVRSLGSTVKSGLKWPQQQQSTPEATHSADVSIDALLAAVVARRSEMTIIDYHQALLGAIKSFDGNSLKMPSSVLFEFSRPLTEGAACGANQ